MGPSLLRLLAATVLATAAVSQPALAMRDGAPGRAGAHAAFSKTASGVDRDFCQLRAPVDASQLAEPRRENGCIYGRSAKDITKDPNGYEDSVNLYAYGANDPINHRDPTGAYLDRNGIEFVGPTNPDATAREYDCERDRLMEELPWRMRDTKACRNGICMTLGERADEDARLSPEPELEQCQVSPENAIGLGGLLKGLLAVGTKVLAIGAIDVAVQSARPLESLAAEELILSHGTTRSSAERILKRGFKPGIGNAVFFAEDSTTATYFASERAFKTGTDKVMQLKFRVPRSLAEELGIERGVIGEYTGLKPADLPMGSSGYELILHGANVQAFNAAVASGKISVTRIPITRLW